MAHRVSKDRMSRQSSSAFWPVEGLWTLSVGLEGFLWLVQVQSKILPSYDHVLYIHACWSVALLRALQTLAAAPAVWGPKSYSHVALTVAGAWIWNQPASVSQLGSWGRGNLSRHRRDVGDLAAGSKPPFHVMLCPTCRCRVRKQKPGKDVGQYSYWTSSRQDALHQKRSSP